jgi:type I restriction enzyme S subunit
MPVQEAIARAIRLKAPLFDELTKQSDLLHERRTALISAAVTGKIDVRGLATQEAA